MCQDLQVAFLGSLPLDPKIAKCSDEGKNFFEEVPDSPVVKAIERIVQGIPRALMLSATSQSSFSGLVATCDETQ